VIQHIVLLKWKPGTTEEQVLEAFGEARDLPNEIEGVERITMGRNRVESEHGFTHALIVELAQEEALGRYLDHPARKRYIAAHLAPLTEQRIEIDVPVDLSIHRDPSRNWQWGASVGMGPPLED
jgi:Stress responsive A/B Barrel Domain